MRLLLLLPIFLLTANFSIAQEDTTTYKIVLANGVELVGKFIEEDKREVLFKTIEGRELYIPQYEITDRIPVKTTDFNVVGDFIGEDKFATRYFITTNGLPMNKGEHYIQWNLFGPDFQFAITDNFGMGVMTSWVGIPIIGTAKYSFQLGKKTQFALGFLAGSGTWALPDWGGILPFGTLSFGDRTKNLAFSGGYGGLWIDGETEGRPLASVAGMIKIGRKFSLVFDSFVLLPGSWKTRTNYIWNDVTMQYDEVQEAYRPPLYALLIPGLRWHQAEGKAFQFGFATIYGNNEFVPFPIPMVQWYRTISSNK